MIKSTSLREEDKHGGLVGSAEPAIMAITNMHKKQFIGNDHNPADRVSKAEILSPACQSEIADASDQLSHLPEEIILHILSFLPLMEAYRTSLLSKRWRYLWALAPDFFFGNDDPKKLLIFMGLVERACALRAGSAIRTFSLACRSAGAVIPIKRSIASVLTYGVRDLSLVLDKSKRPYVLPISIFSCETLEKLQVKSRCFLKLPSSFCLTKLRVLILLGVILESNDSLDKLFSRPSHETLELCCDWKNLKSIHISAPKLQILNLNMFGSGKHVLALHVDGPCLKYFHYSGELFGEHYISVDATNLVEANVLTYPDGLQLAQAFKLLSVCSNIKVLTLSKVFEGFAARDGLPVFSNMVKLTLDEDLSEWNIDGFWALLRRCPHLKSLYFQFDYSLKRGKADCLHPVPSCLLTEIREISVRVCRRLLSREEYFLMKFFLENAMALEEMTLRSYWDCKHEGKTVDLSTKLRLKTLKPSRCRISTSNELDLGLDSLQKLFGKKA